MPEPGAERRRPFAVVTLLAGMCLLAACTGGAGTSAPAPGQARVLTGATGGSALEQAVAMRPGEEPNGISSGPDGSVYLAVPPFIARISPKGKIGAAASGPAVDTPLGSPRGVVAMPDGTLVTASDGQLLRITPGRGPAVLAGVKGKVRSLTALLPAAGPARAMRFTRYLAPVGALGDGSLMLADGNAVWRLSEGQITRFYQHAAVKATGGYQPSVRGDGAAVSSDGVLYLLPEGPGRTLRDMVVLSAAGKAGQLRLPATVKGIRGEPGTLTPLWGTSDGDKGVYVHAFRSLADGRSDGEYVLHVHDGKAELIAASYTTGTPADCAATEPADARKFPCPLPWAITHQPGRLVMAGGEPYVIEIPLAKP
jgi:hypothetical protein